MSITVITQGFVRPVGLRVQAAANQVIVAQRNGRLFAVDLATADSTPVGAAQGRVNAFDVTEDGQSAYVAGDRLGVWKVSLNGGPNHRLVRGPVHPMGVRVNSEGMLLVAEGRAPGRLISIDPDPIGATVRARGLRNARALTQERLTGRVLVAEATGGGRIVEPVAGAFPTVLLSGLGRPVDIAALEDDQQLLVCDRAGQRVVLVDLSRPGGAPAELFSDVEDLWAAQPLASGRFIIGAGDALLLGEVTAAERDRVELEMRDGELFIGGWVRVPVTINDPSIAFDDLDFHVKPRHAAAMVSSSRDNSFDPANPHILLTAGWMAGEHKLIVIHRPTDEVVGEITFNVLDTWEDQKLGPSIATFGSIESGPSGGTWGGADSGDFNVPQNVGVNPALGTRNIGVVLVDTSTARYPSGAALNTIINNLRNEMVNGVMIGGQNRSVATYFNQASNNLFNLNLVGIVGPIMLPNNWNSYFTFDDPDGDGNGNWVPNNDFPATVIAQIVQQNVNNANAGNPPVLDLSQMDSLIYVVRSRVSPPDPDLFVWPRASLQTETHVIGSVPLPTPFGTLEVPSYRGIAYVYMPDDWATREDREFHETVAHEIGHNLGLADQYAQTGFSADATSRIADANPNQSWELMSWERDLPLPSAAHRLMLGWLNPNWVRLYNFGVFGPMDETINLRAASLGAPPNGQFAAAEVRLEDGKNYYFEYRPSVAGRIVDPNPPEANAVLGTEAEFRSSKTADHPNILRVEEDVDTVIDRGAFQIGDDFRDRDTSTPGFTNDFIVDVTNTTANTATIRVRYAPDEKPDPGLTPWSASTNWQSPDIEVINGRSQADSAFRNIPWEGHDNTIVARVTNRGLSPARGVKVKFFSKDFTFGGGAEEALGDQTQDIPVGATVTFTAPQLWRPPAVWFPLGEIKFKQHACLVARIDPFLDPVSNIWEVTPENNEAQSNYTWMATTTSSPASREATTIVAENPFDKPAFVYFTVHQPHPLFRTYLDHRWVYLEPGEQKRILVMVESLLGDKRFEPMVRNFRHQERRIQTTLRLSALGDTRETCAATVIGGASILAITGIGTRFESFEAQSGRADGFIVRTDTGQGVDGKVLVSILPRRPDDNSRKEIIREAEVIDGRFRVEIGEVREAIVQAHYLGKFPLGPCESKEVRIS